jgi:hypothetical protein
LRAVNPFTKIRSGAASAGTRIKGAGASVGSKTKTAGNAAIAKPRDAGKALAGGFRWAGGGAASRTKATGNRVRSAIAAKTSPPWNAAKERFQANPWMGIAAITGAVLLIAWIAWAIYVTSENGANAGLGVVISWPAVFMAVALVAAPFVGVYLLVRHLQGDDASDPPMAGGAPDGGDDSGGTAGTYPG